VCVCVGGCVCVCVGVCVCVVCVCCVCVWGVCVCCVCVCVCVCVGSLRYPACKAHAPHRIAISDLSGCTIFFHVISSMPRSSGKKRLLNVKFLYRFCEIFLIFGRIQLDIVINVLRYSREVHVILVRF